MAHIHIGEGASNDRERWILVVTARAGVIADGKVSSEGLEWRSLGHSYRGVELVVRVLHRLPKIQALLEDSWTDLHPKYDEWCQ